jgi:acetoin utilization protein AcuC
MRPVRLAHMKALTDATGLLTLPGVGLVPPRPATVEELGLVHTAEYVEAVRQLDGPLAMTEVGAYGFGPGDNPIYEGIFAAQALSAGSAIVAMELVEAGEADVAFAPAGGLHHAMPGRASGFCVFNDPAIIIERLTKLGHRVAYVDIDCHHGDGVQHIFYGRDDVLTISLHESGQFLFPGTGYTGDTGAGAGVGYSVNVPLAPYTGDSVYHAAFDATIPPLIRAFKPDVLVTQLGIDTHLFDPITHLRLTTQGFASLVASLSILGDEAGKWIALGGGGYDLGAVARGWTMAFAVMCGSDIPRDIPDGFDVIPGLSRFPDTAPDTPGEAAASQIEAFAERSVEEIRANVFPHYGI